MVGLYSFADEKAKHPITNNNFYDWEKPFSQIRIRDAEKKLCCAATSGIEFEAGSGYPSNVNQYRWIKAAPGTMRRYPQTIRRQAGRAGKARYFGLAFRRL